MYSLLAMNGAPWAYEDFEIQATDESTNHHGERLAKMNPYAKPSEYYQNMIKRTSQIKPHFTKHQLRNI